MNGIKAAIGALALSAAVAGVANAQPVASAAQGGASVAQLPDWSGAWTLDDASFAKARAASGSLKPGDPDVPPLTPKYAEMRRGNGAANNGQGPAGGVKNNASKCIPDGMPGLMMAPFSFEFLFTPGRVTIIPENNQVRRIYTDGRAHPADPDATFNGDSVGHWEGRTLVVDTTAILPQSEFFMGLRESGKTHVVERMFRKEADTFEIDTTVTDPEALTMPWSYSRTYKHVDNMIEYVCEQNNRDQNGAIDLTPPQQ